MTPRVPTVTPLPPGRCGDGLAKGGVLIWHHGFVWVKDDDVLSTTKGKRMTWQRELNGRMRLVGFKVKVARARKSAPAEPKRVTDVKQIVESAKAHGLVARRLPSKLEPKWVAWGLSHASA